MEKYRSTNKICEIFCKILCCKMPYKVVQFSRKVVLNMAVKTANVTARIQPEIKESAEAILEKLGIPVSVFIDMTYRQVIANNGVPFALNVSKTITTRDEMTDTQFDSIMEKGLMQAKADDSRPAKDVFADLRKRV